ncbi:MAG: hypothetical protein WC285_03250 [Candidatus Gracilibacteria bacterium]
MQLADLKSCKTFLVICGLFLVTIGLCLFFYMQYMKELSPEIIEKEASLEITLPIIEWGKYENLSKKLGNDKIEK